MRQDDKCRLVSFTCFYLCTQQPVYIAAVDRLYPFPEPTHLTLRRLQVFWQLVKFSTEQRLHCNSILSCNFKNASLHVQPTSKSPAKL